MTGADTLDELLDVAAGVARIRGAAAFPALVRALTRIFGVQEALLAERAGNAHARTLAALSRGADTPNYEYALEGTPCHDVVAGAVVWHAADAADRFPRWSAGHVGYFGVPVCDPLGHVLGHFCVAATQPLAVSARQRQCCEILAACAASEFQRRANARLSAENRSLRARLAAVHDVDELVGSSPVFARLLESVQRIAATGMPVLLVGEAGTGRRLLAFAIHAAGPRAAQPFATVECAELGTGDPAGSDPDPDPDTGDALAQLLPEPDAQLALAAGGSLFLESVDLLPAPAQARLLALLADQESARHVGAGVAEVRVIASTTRDLRKAVEAGEFDARLHERLAGCTLEVPPLRARPEDIGPLVHYFLRKHGERYGRRVDAVDPDTLANLGRYSWPGNVRELENLIERALMLNNAPVLKIPPEMLVALVPMERAELAAAATGAYRTLQFPGVAPDLDDLAATGLHHVQREHILRVLQATRWVIEGNSGAALKLGMKPATLRHRMKKLGIARAAGTAAPDAGAR